MSLSDQDLEKITKEELVAEYRRVEEARDLVFSVASHDLRSPFSGLLGLSGMLATGTDDLSAGELSEYLVTMNESLKNTYLLLENLFEWGQIERERFDKTVEQIPLQILIDEVLEPLSPMIERKGISIRRLCDAEQLVTGNSKMIEFVLKNFISNAVKFSHKGGIVEVGFDPDSPAVFVKDHGIGISEENTAKLFSMKTRWRIHGTEGENGTGLGLIVSTRFASVFGAELKVESTPGEGSTFFLILTEARA